MNPKINFAYSLNYDKHWNLLLEEKFNPKGAKEKYDLFISNLRNVWTSEEEKILNLISKYSNLKWIDPEIKIYFVSALKVSGFSDPLTIKMNEDYLKIVETLIHELLHIILVQNIMKIKPVMIELLKLFPKEEKRTRIHLLINFLSDKIFREVFGEEEANRIKNISRKFIGLKRAYELLEDEGNKSKIRELVYNIGK
ncbi:hypothetical protein HOD29_02025 [archaeon]|jgi:hypothetical protein|nr:hypothetical protein [archaeon]